ncbi:Inactive tyrosine-protein kinase transmembrane receptor ROR1 [Holothuria leucospilota]|uniref:Inactive tyrosine-protein kinase transmembrane receptor ROR1 n=1 Tax=Holothuria leucospilota TaxID=206669 RepID=A0A9Q1H4G5_HOLLE|nr:Inactive tyrosine-protein kinase transmembrane receptor ROR1 [Holothuria leucospilota]
MDFIYWHLPLASVLVLVQVVPSKEQNVCRSMDPIQNSTTCIVEVNTSVCLVCPIREAAHKQSSENWWYHDDPIYKNGNQITPSNTKISCSSELYSLLVPHVVLSGMDILYYCEKSKTNRFEFNIKYYVNSSLVIQANDEHIQQSLRKRHNQRMTFRCYIFGAIPPLNMAWLINYQETNTTFFPNETNQPGNFSHSLNVTIAKGFTNITCSSSGPYIWNSSKTIVIEGIEDQPLNGNDLLVFYIAVPCLFVTSLLTTFILYFKVKNGRHQSRSTRTEDRQTVNIDDSESADISNAFVYSDITKECEPTTSQVISSPPLKISLVTCLKTGGKFDYWSATYISESSEEKCFAKTLSSYATMKDAAMFQDLAMNLQSLKNSAFVVQLMFVSVEEIPYAIYYEYMECGSLRDFMLRRYQQARSSRMSIKDADILPANVKSQIQELLTFATMVTAGMKFITSQKFSHPALLLRKVLLSEYCECKLYDIYPTEMAMARINDLMTKDYPPIAWLAPETIFLHEYETSSDVWSFAVLLWELFSLGDTPFARDTAGEVEQKIREGVVLSQTLCCPGAMYGMMLSCWNTASNKRPTFDGMLPKMEMMLEKLKENEAKLPHQNEVPQPSYFILDTKEASNNYI